MSFAFNSSNPQSEITTATGHIVMLEMLYGTREIRGVSILVVAAGVSLLSVVGLLVVLGFSAYKTMRTPNTHRLMRTHVVAYFVSLLICDVISAVGSLMNGRWISQNGVHLDAFCTAQGALKNTGNVGTALWSLVIAVHTFCLLVLKWRSRDYVLYITLFVVWAFIGLVVIIGPAGVQSMTNRGPYFGVSGYWCWITDGYAVQRVTLEYFWMFLSAAVSFVLYSMVFLCLRGNIIVSGGKLRIRFSRPTTVWEAQTGRESADGQAVSLAKHMLAYPIAYTSFILPITICRFMEWVNHDVPFEVTIFADTVFMLSGFTNVILFTTTRNIIPTRDTSTQHFSRVKSHFDIESQKLFVATSVTSFVVAEKVTVSPIKSEPQLESRLPVMPVSRPVPSVQVPREGRRPVPKRGISLAPTVASDYSQQSARPESALPPMPKLRIWTNPVGTSIRQSANTSLNVVQKPLASRSVSPLGATSTTLAGLTATPEELEQDLGHRESWGNESCSRYSGSSIGSTTPLRPPVRPLPRIPTAAANGRPQFSKTDSFSSSMNSSRAPGTRF